VSEPIPPLAKGGTGGVFFGRGLRVYATRAKTALERLSFDGNHGKRIKAREMPSRKRFRRSPRACGRIRNSSRPVAKPALSARAPCVLTAS
jgi:hypothetical protein